MRQNNDNNARLLRMISGLQNQIDRLERKQPYEAVFVGTRNEDTAFTANVEQRFYINEVSINQGLIFDDVESYWTVMSGGVYAINLQLATSVGLTAVQWRLFIGPNPIDPPAIGYRYHTIASPVPRALHSGTMIVYLEEGWRFSHGIALSADATLVYRNPALFAFPAPVMTITQLSGAYEQPNTVNEWYYEDGDEEPR